MTPRVPVTPPVPTTQTARRLEWSFLPPHVRSLVEERCGSSVTGAVSQTAGFTPGFASVLTCADGSRHFVKAASVAAQRSFADSYREEARKLALVPEDVPAPRLLWHEDGDWVVLGIEYVDATNPARPWREEDVDAVLDTLEVVADALTPAPVDMHLDTFAQEFGDILSGWDHVRATRPGLPHLDEAAELAAGFTEVVAGDSLVHTDVRADNVLLTRDRRVLFCDWNWPVLGAAWLDTVFFLIGPRGDGCEVDRRFAERRLLRDVPPEHVDRVLALLVGYFLRAGDQPEPPTSPYLRAHQRWQGEACWAWLCDRRGWS